LLAYIAGSNPADATASKERIRKLPIFAGNAMCLVIVPGDTLVYSQIFPQSQPTASSDQAAKPEEQAAKIPADHLDSLVAPISL
jgi:hypothetical protein